MHQFLIHSIISSSNNSINDDTMILFAFIEITLFPTFLLIFHLLTCAKPRRQKYDPNSPKNAHPQHRSELRQKTTATNTTKTRTETTRDIGSAPSAASAAQHVQNDQKGGGDPSKRIHKKSIKTSKEKNNNNINPRRKPSKKSKREKSKEEKTKKESHLKKFLHKFGGGNSEKKDTKTHSLDEGPPEVAAGGGQNNDENEKVPFSSRKAAKRRKMLGENFKTAEDNDVTNTQAEEEPKVVDPVKVVQMGNIDIITQQEKNKRIREIEQMPSGNYCEEPTQLSKSIKKENMHVKIVETNCKLYETNAEPMTKSLKESIRKRKKVKHQLRPRSRGSDSK